MTPSSWLNCQEVDGGTFHLKTLERDWLGIVYYDFSFGHVEFEVILRHLRDDVQQQLDKCAWNLEVRTRGKIFCMFGVQMANKVMDMDQIVYGERME